jgi:hypothetical protein
MMNKIAPMDIAAIPIVVAMPKGKNRLMIMPMNRSCFIAEDHSIIARFFPDCSRIMASWTIVSSRCVSGLSTGILELSVMKIMMNGTNSSQRKIWFWLSSDSLIISKKLMLSKLKATAAKTTMMVGSMIAEMLISRELPMPPNVLPASRPLREIKTLVSINTYKNSMTLPRTLEVPGINIRGTNKTSSRDPMKLIYGAIRMMIDELREYRLSFFNNLNILRYVWRMPGPFLPCIIAFTFFIMEIYKGDRNSAKNRFMTANNRNEFTLSSSPDKSTMP